MSFIEREISAAIVEASRFFPVITITGPRQSGKSTLAKHLFPDFIYINLENPDTREIAENDPRSLLNKSNLIIFDEVQRCPNLVSYIQTYVDEDPQRKIVLTGSSNFSMIKNVSQSLAGRTAIFELLPLSWAELNIASKTEPINSQLLKGFYPAVIAQSIPYNLYYKSYTATYLERDVRSISEIKNLDTFQRFLRLCAGRIGSIFVASELAGELGISVNTVNAWLAILQASYIIYMLKPFASNINKRLIKSRKLYFTDTGLASSLLGISEPSQMDIDRMRGHLFENMIVIEALKKCYNKAGDADLYFYRDSNGVEIDLMTRNGSRYDCFEIKSSATYHSDFEKSIVSFEKHFSEYVASKNVIYTGDDTFTEGSVRILNLSNFYDYI